MYKRGKVWWIWVRDAGGKLRRVSTKQTDRQAALLVKRKLERQHADPAHHAANNTTVEEVIKRFLKSKGQTSVAAGTMVMYEQKSGHIARLFGPGSKVAKITGDAVDTFIATREDEGASAHTIHKELVTLRQVLKTAKRMLAFPADLATVIPSGFSAKYEPKKTFLNEGQVVMLLAELEPERAAHVAYVVATGARRAEAMRATRASVNGAYARIEGTKTAASKRSVPIVFPFYESLLERTLRDAPGKDLLFTPWQNARRDILRACARAGVPEVTWNDLRRTFASLLKQNGVRVEDLATLLGHTSTAMVRKVYGQDTPESLAESVRAELRHRTKLSHGVRESAIKHERKRK